MTRCCPTHDAHDAHIEQLRQKVLNAKTEEERKTWMAHLIEAINNQNFAIERADGTLHVRKSSL